MKSEVWIFRFVTNLLFPVTYRYVAGLLIEMRAFKHEICLRRNRREPTHGVTFFDNLAKSKTALSEIKE
jgi:hypothetical protein